MNKSICFIFFPLIIVNLLTHYMSNAMGDNQDMTNNLSKIKSWAEKEQKERNKKLMYVISWKWQLRRGKPENEVVNKVQVLLTAGADINAVNVFKQTVLHVAAENGRNIVVCTLLEKKANIDATDCNGNTPLHEAAGNGHNIVVCTLLEKKANIDATTCIFGSTPLHKAASNGHNSVVCTLLEKKADIDATDSTGDTPLLLAVENGHNTVACSLLENKANINTTDSTGDTPLLLAVENGHNTVACSLLENKANIDAVNDHSIRVLYNAAYEGQKNKKHKTTIKTLLKHIPDLNELDKEVEQILDDEYTPEKMEADPLGLHLSNPVTVGDYERKAKIEGLMELIGLIGKEEDRRVCSEIQTFLLASHQRLGKDSPAHVLSQYLFQKIYEQLKKL